MADRCERFFLFSSESERSDGSGGLSWEYITPAPAVSAVPAPVVEYIAPAPRVSVVEYIAPAPAVPVVEHIAPAPAVYPALAPVVEDSASALVSPPIPVVEFIATVPTSTPAVSSPPATCVQSRQSAPSFHGSSHRE